MTAPRGTALITGASAGLGAEFARVFAAEGWNLVLVARRAAELSNLTNELRAAHPAITIQANAMDLTEPGAAERLITQLQKPVTALVNNAGFGTLGPVLEMDSLKLAQMVDLNNRVLVELTTLVLPAMHARGEGYILNVASTAAFQPGPRMAVYYATKAFVLSFSEALWYELRGSGVRVSCLCPGPTETEFAKVSGMNQTQVFAGGNVMRARPVVEAGYRGMLRGKRVVVPGWTNWFGTTFVRFLPRRMILFIIDRVQRKRG
ncbi:MAG: SDR family NAD(P)-dependent oxidoreductase [Gemmataceae bacterium]